MSFLTKDVLPIEAFEEIQRELVRRPLTLCRTRLNSGPGRTQTFGIVRIRRQQPGPSRHSRDRPYLYKLLLDFGDKYLRQPGNGGKSDPLFYWNSITVNIDYMCLPHFDSGNRGDSAIVAFGDYTGGGELVFGDKTIDIKRRLFIGNFKTTLHSVKPWTSGHRYSLVYYHTPDNRPSPLPRPVPLQQSDGEWMLSHNGKLIPKYKKTKRNRAQGASQGASQGVNGKLNKPHGNDSKRKKCR